MQTDSNISSKKMASCLALILGLISVGCGTQEKNAKMADERLVGVWEMNLEATQNVQEANAKTDLEKKGAALLKGINLKYRYEFKDDGTVSYGFMAGSMPPIEATYEINEVTRDSAMLDITYKENTDQFKIVFQSDDEMDLEILKPSKTRAVPKITKLTRISE